MDTSVKISRVKYYWCHFQTHILTKHNVYLNFNNLCIYIILYIHLLYLLNGREEAAYHKIPSDVFLLVCENSGISRGIFTASVFVRWIVLTKALTCPLIVKCKWKVGFRLIFKLFSLKPNDVTLSSHSHVIHHRESASTHFPTYLPYFVRTSNFPKDVCIIEETLK